MKYTFEMYLIDVGDRSHEYTYSKDVLYDNIEYFKGTHKSGLSAYKALLFLHDYLEDKNEI